MDSIFSVRGCVTPKQKGSETWYKHSLFWKFSSAFQDVIYKFQGDCGLYVCQPAVTALLVWLACFSQLWPLKILRGIAILTNKGCFWIVDAIKRLSKILRHILLKFIAITYKSNPRKLVVPNSWNYLILGLVLCLFHPNSLT